MGIRYYAYPVGAAHIDDARANPYEYLGTDPYYRERESTTPPPEMLYLDKCWWYLQHLLATPPGRPSRPAAALVAGSVVQTDKGWIPHVQVLSPSVVSDAGRDLASIGGEDIRQSVHDLRWFSSGTEQDNISYVTEYLGLARHFTAHLADSERGMIYLIG